MTKPSLLFLPAMLLLAACSPFGSGGDPFASGRDGRVFNAATGRYEWSETDSPRSASKSPAVISALHAAPATPAPNDGREYNAAKGRFEPPVADAMVPTR